MHDQGVRARMLCLESTQPAPCKRACAACVACACLETRSPGVQATNLHVVPQHVVGHKGQWTMRRVSTAYNCRYAAAIAFKLTGWWKGAGDAALHQRTHASGGCPASTHANGGRTASACMHSRVHSGIT